MFALMSMDVCVSCFLIAFFLGFVVPSEVITWNCVSFLYSVVSETYIQFYAFARNVILKRNYVVICFVPEWHLPLCTFCEISFCAVPLQVRVRSCIQGVVFEWCCLLLCLCTFHDSLRPILNGPTLFFVAAFDPDVRLHAI